MIDHDLVPAANIWYTVGLIATDGNLSIDGRHINITSKDIEYLELVKKGLLLTNKITRKARGGETEKRYGVLAFGDVKFYRYLLHIGLTPHKSLTLGELVIPDAYFPDFARGVIDGDGCIRRWIHPQNGGEQWELKIFSSAKKFTYWLYGKIEGYFGVKGVVIINPETQIGHERYVIKFGKMAAQRIFRTCYYPGALALARKDRYAKQCLESLQGWSRSFTVKI